MTIENINEPKSWFFEKKIDKRLARLIKVLMRKRNEREVSTETTDKQRIIRDYYE